MKVAYFAWEQLVAGDGDSQIRALLGVHDGGDRDTKVGDGAPEICKRRRDVSD